MIQIFCTEEQELVDIFNSLAENCPFAFNDHIECLNPEFPNEDRICGGCVNEHIHFNLLSHKTGNYESVNHKMVYSTARAKTLYKEEEDDK